MARLSIVTRPSKREDDRSRPIALRISHKASTRYIFLGIRVRPKHWNKQRSEVRRSDERYRKINRYLQEVKSKATDALTDLQTSGAPLEAGRIKEAINRELEGGEHAGGFITFAREEIQGYEDRGQETTAETYRTAINKVEAFHQDTRPTDEPRMDEITPAYLEDYRTWMARERENSLTTRSHALACLRVFWNRARRQGEAPERSPFDHITLEYDRSSKTPLTRGELDTFAALDLPGRDRLWHVQQTFLLQVYGMGMRLADVAQLGWENVRRGRLTYSMQKSGKEVDVALVEGAERVLERYEYRRGKDTVLPWMDAYRDYMHARKSLSQKLNAGLKELAGRAGIEKKVTTQVARETFALIAVQSGWTVREVQAALKHSSIATTEKYLREVTTGELDEKMEDLF